MNLNLNALIYKPCHIMYKAYISLCLDLNDEGYFNQKMYFLKLEFNLKVISIRFQTKEPVISTFQLNIH